MTRTWLNYLCGLLLLLGPIAAHAQTCTASFANVAFGSISTVSSNPTDLVGNSTINCSGFSTPYVNVCLSLGDPRTMNGPSSSTLSYDLYVDSARSQRWGSVWAGPTATWITATIALSGGKGNASVPFYARVFGNQGSAVAGAYSQTFTGSWTGVQGIAFSSGSPVCTSSTTQYGTFSLTLTATVVAECLISATNIDFGQVGLILSPVNSTGQVSSTCTKNAPFSISLSAGQGVGASMSARRMTLNGGSQTLSYGLYTDAARSSPWGDGTGGTGTVSGNGTGSAQTSTIYATLLAPASVPPGVYADTVVATITY